MVDIDSGISNGTSLSSFADDTRALKGVKNIFDCTKLQEDLFTVYEWASDNNMEYNSSKFEAVRYGLDEVLKLCTNYVSDRGTIIDQKDHIRDLGITIAVIVVSRITLKTLSKTPLNSQLGYLEPLDPENLMLC